MDERIVKTDSGTLTLWSPAPGVFASRAEGSMDAVHADAYVEYGDAVLAVRSPAIGMHDWQDMTGYGPGVRGTVTNWAMRVIRDFREIHIYMESSVVRMGVAVANMALGGKLRTYKTRQEFNDATAEVVRRVS